MSNMEKSTTDEQEKLDDDLNEIVSFTEDVLERMDAKSIAGHLTLVKRVGVILITFTSILCFAATMQIVLSSVPQTNTTDNVQSDPFVCSIEQKYALTEEVYLTVCSKRNVSVIEMRKFYNGQPTSDGLFVSLVQWTFLKRLVPFVDKTLHIARV